VRFTPVGPDGLRYASADEVTAVAAGYRPCVVCLPEAYGAWRNRERGSVFCS
jgi:hypothetical protein